MLKKMINILIIYFKCLISLDFLGGVVALLLFFFFILFFLSIAFICGYIVDILNVSYTIKHISSR